MRLVHHQEQLKGPPNVVVPCTSMGPLGKHMRVMAKHTLCGGWCDTHHEVGNAGGSKAKVERFKLALAQLVLVMGLLQCVKQR